LSSAGWVDRRRHPLQARRIFKFFHDLLQPLGVFDKLSVSQRVELVALVARLQSHSQNWREDRYVQKQLGKIASEAPRRIRKIKSKLRAVAEALDDLVDYIEPLREHQLAEMILGIGLGLPSERRIPPVENLRAEAARFRNLRPATLDEINADQQQILAGVEPAASRADVRNRQTSALVDFFTATCGLSDTQTNLRIGKIAQAVFGHDVAVTDDEMGPRSEAVRSRRRRMRPVTPRKKS
jgi:hypothetical protein